MRKIMITVLLIGVLSLSSFDAVSAVLLGTVGVCFAETDPFAENDA